MKEKLEELGQELHGLPEKIMEKQIELLEVQESLINLDSELQSLENEIRIQILEALNEEGKKAYPNDQSRDGAFKLRSSQDPKIVSIRESIRSGNSRSKVFQFEIEKLSNKQRNLRVLLDLQKSFL